MLNGENSAGIENKGTISAELTYIVRQKEKPYFESSHSTGGEPKVFFKTEKRHGDKEEGLSIIKDQLIHNSVVISSNCKNLFEEMQRYAKDSRGRIPKKNDHLIDCYRYLIDAANYDFNSVMEFVRRIDPMEDGRFRRWGDENEIDLDDDWTSDFGDDMDLDWD